MKVQYFGDVSDFRKYALLRAFARAGLKLGVCWVMTESDGRSDGQFRRYQAKPELWRAFDPDLFDLLCEAPPSPTENDLKRFEAANLIPGALYFDALTPDGKADRLAWHGKALDALVDADLVFFDPDNGFEIASCAKGRLRSNKFVFFDEVADHYREGRSVLIYQHFPRKSRNVFIQELADKMEQVLPGADVWAFETAHVVFILGAQPGHVAHVEPIAQFIERNWLPNFFKRTNGFVISAVREIEPGHVE